MPDVDLPPPDGHPVTRRKNSGYYDTPYGSFRSVTTILDGGIPKPALPHWYASQVATCAITHLPYLSKVRGRPAREAAFTWLRMAAERTKNEAGDIGSEVHHWAEARLLDVAPPPLTDDAKPFVTAFERFLDEWHPSFEATEMVVANPGEGYAGTCDAWMRLRGLGFVINIVDYKTGKGVWPEAALQVTAYQRCPVGWLKNGTEVEPPRAERGWVLHLRPKYRLDGTPLPGGVDRGYEMFPVDLSDETFRQFLHARDVDAGRPLRAAALGEPADPPELPALPEVS